MKDWRDHKGPGAMTDFVDPNTANNTPARKRGRIESVIKARENQAIANNSLNRNRASAAREARNPDRATRALADQFFGDKQTDADDADGANGDSKKYLMPLRNDMDDQDDGPVDPSLLQQPEDYESLEKVEDEEPPKKRRTRRTKAEMEVFRAEKEAARLRREQARAEKLAALDAKKTKVVKQEPNDGVVQMSPPANPSTLGGTVDLFGISLFEGAVTNASAFNSPSAEALVPKAQVQGGAEAYSPAQAAPTHGVVDIAQPFNGVMTYPAPDAQTAQPPFQSGSNMGMMHHGAHRGMQYGIPNGRSMAPGYMMPPYPQPMNMNANSYGYGMQGFMQPPNPYAFVPNQMQYPPVYFDQNIVDPRLMSDARVILDGERVTDLENVKSEHGSEHPSEGEQQGHGDRLPVDGLPSGVITID